MLKVRTKVDALEDILAGSFGAERVRRFLRLAKHVKGPKAGQPFELADWQDAEIIEPL